jgi:hypothetical protein
VVFATTVIGGEVAPLPQANSLACVAAVVDAIAEGCDDTASVADAIGMSGRQGAYYPNAAATLGLVTTVAGSHPMCWRLTAAGLAFVGLDAAGRATAMAHAIASYGQVQLYRTEGVDALEKQYLLDGLADSTARRRVSTIGAWSAWAEQAAAGHAENELGEASAATRLRAPQVLAARKAAEKRAAPRPTPVCGRCYVQLAANGTCSIC